MTIADELSERFRSLEPERYLATLYLPENIRFAVQVLYLFDSEILRIPSLVSEPMPGEIRLQWWRDVLMGQRAGEAAANPLACAVLETIGKYDLPAEGFIAYLDARVFDLYNDPMPDKQTYEGYLGETSSFWFLMAALCAGLEQNSELGDAAGHAGVAYGMARNLAYVSRWNANKQVFVPSEILKENNLETSDWLYLQPDDRHLNVVSRMCDEATEHLNKSKVAISQLPKNANPIFLPLIFTESLIAKIRKSGAVVFSEPVHIGPLKRQYLALRASFRGSLK